MSKLLEGANNKIIFYLTICICVVILVLIYLKYGEVDIGNKSSLQAKQRIVDLMEIINPGDARAKVELAISDKQSFSLDVIKTSDEEWIIKTPLEFGARNWILYLIFKDDVVTSLFIRTSDDKSVRPEGAPNDKG